MLEKLKRRLADSRTEIEAAEWELLLRDLLTDAENFVKGYTGKSELPESLDSVIVELAAGSYRRLGIEGESSHSEGGVSAIIEGLPRHLKALLDHFRMARVGG